MTNNPWDDVYGRKVTRRRALQTAGLGGVGLAAVGLIGCGDDDDDDDDAGGDATATTVADSKPVPGGNMQVALSSDPPTLDPQGSISFNTIIPASFVYSRLLRFKSSSDPAEFAQYEPEPDLAVSYERSDDLKTWTFKLREGVTFHNGDPFTSEDVAATWQRFVDKPAANRSGLAMVDTVTTPDPTTVVFTLKQPYAPFDRLMASPNYFWIIPKAAVAGTIDLATTMVGTGPFMFDNYETGVAMRLQKNPSYYLEGQPYLERVTLNIVKDTEARLGQLRSGGLHMSMIGETLRDAESVRSARSSVRLIEYPQAGLWFFYFQALNPASEFYSADSPFNDERVRRAVSRVRSIATRCSRSCTRVAGSWNNIPPTSFGEFGIDPRDERMGDLRANFEYSVDEAKKLLADAGYPDGFSTKLNYALSVYGDSFQQQVELVANMLTQVGIKVELNGQDYISEYISKTFRGQFEGLSFGPQSAFTEVDEFVFSMFHSTGTRNHSTILDPEIDALIDTQRIETDFEKRKEIVLDITRRNADQMFYVPTVIDNRIFVLQEEVQNFAFGSTYSVGTETFANIWLKA